MTLAGRRAIVTLDVELMPPERIAATVARSLEERIQGAQWVIWPGLDASPYEWNPAVAPLGTPA